jgi:hypothetical protein
MRRQEQTGWGGLAAMGFVLFAAGMELARTATPEPPCHLEPPCPLESRGEGEVCPTGPVDESMPGGAMPSRLGVASCSASSCHGGPKGTNHAVSTFAATLWMERDPHARASEVLHSGRSRRMAELLGIGPAHQAHRCLVCHSMADLSPTPLPDDLVADGVGCASCHGNPTAWGSEHTLDAWKRMGREERAALGYRDLSTPLDRVNNCTRCHVGDAEHDVDHALIAAGHPRLVFEFAAYQKRYPRHWRPAGRAEVGTDFKARSWAVGQAATLAATARLLEARVSDPPARATSAVPGGRWPEFAEFDCQGCHRSIASVAPPSVDAVRPGWSAIGTPAWQPWTQAGGALLSGNSADGDLDAGLADLRRLLERHWGPADQTRRGRVRLQARALAGAAARRAEALEALDEVDLDDVATKIEALVAEGGPGIGSWEAAVQSVLALEAVLDGGPAQLGNTERNDVDRHLEGLRESLRYPPRQETPPTLRRSDFKRLRATVP